MTILRRLSGGRARSVLAAGLFTSMLLVATSSWAASMFPDNFVPAHSGLTDHLALASHRLVAGSYETGFLVVDNRTKTTINLTKECQPQLEGLLGSARYAQTASSDLVCSNEAALIRPGVTRLPVRFVATYSSCSQDANAAIGMTRCLDGNKLPALPSGTYHAHVDGGGAALPAPRAITVHVADPWLSSSW
jgi:hypothetical protein